MMSAMSENGMHDESEPSVLGSLPRTRPQRPSRRRESAKSAAKAGGSAPRASQASAAKTARSTSAKPHATKTSTAKAGTAKASAAKASAAKTPPPRRREPPAPKQGYEPMEEPKTGLTVHPPSGTELVESIATIFAELASVGVKAGGRVLKDALSPIRRT